MSEIFSDSLENKAYKLVLQSEPLVICLLPFPSKMNDYGGSYLGRCYGQIELYILKPVSCTF
jgi:hypothetical protein